MLILLRIDRLFHFPISPECFQEIKLLERKLSKNNISQWKFIQNVDIQAPNQ